MRFSQEQFDALVKRREETKKTPPEKPLPKTPEETLPQKPSGPLSFVVPGTPVPAPRQSRRDSWKPRPCVLRYREFKDRCRAAAPSDLPKSAGQISLVFFLPIPASWPKSKKRALAGQPHRQKPDADNLTKALKDALWEEDSGIWKESAEKRWEDIRGPRTEITVTT